MPLPLASAALVDNRRALAQRARAYPVWAAALGVAALLAPLGATATGRTLGRVLGPALGDPAVARAFMAGLVLTTLAAGLSLGLVVSGAGVLGGQVGSAPASVLDRAAAVLTLPLGGVLAAAIAVGLPAGLPVVRAAPGGLPSLPGLSLGLAGALCAGGVLSACLRARSSSALGAACLAAATSVAATSLSAVVVADALAGRAHSATAALAAAAGAVLSLSAWALLAAAPREDNVGGGCSRPLPSSRAGATAVVAGLLLLRRHDLRSALLGGVAIGLAGIGIARLGAAPPPAALLLATTGTAVTLAPCGLAVGGALRAAEHVWSLVPERALVAGAWLCASVVATSAPAVAVCLAALAVEGGSSSGVGIALALAAGAWGAAVLAGTIVPWRPAGLAEQAASLGACAVLWGSLSVVIALAGPRAVELGIPPAIIVVAILGIVVAGAYHGLQRLLAEVS